MAESNKGMLFGKSWFQSAKKHGEVLSNSPDFKRKSPRKAKSAVSVEDTETSSPMRAAVKRPRADGAERGALAKLKYPVEEIFTFTVPEPNGDSEGVVQRRALDCIAQFVKHEEQAIVATFGTHKVGELMCTAINRLPEALVAAEWAVNTDWKTDRDEEKLKLISFYNQLTNKLNGEAEEWNKSTQAAIAGSDKERWEELHLIAEGKGVAISDKPLSKDEVPGDKEKEKKKRRKSSLVPSAPTSLDLQKSLQKACADIFTEENRLGAGVSALDRRLKKSESRTAQVAEGLNQQLISGEPKSLILSITDPKGNTTQNTSGSATATSTRVTRSSKSPLKKSPATGTRSSSRLSGAGLS